MPFNIKDRIIIIGCCGAGKSTLAIHMAEITGIPLIHLDKEYYKPLWEKPAPEEWERKMRELVSAPKWILDGNYYNTMETRLIAADTVIFLDIDRFTCIHRIIKRILLPSGHQRKDMASGCRERLDIDLISYVWNFNTNMRPRIYKLLIKYNNINLVILKNIKEIQEFIKKLNT
jgi:adenylate kinase family enzyme